MGFGESTVYCCALAEALGVAAIVEFIVRSIRFEFELALPLLPTAAAAVIAAPDLVETGRLLLQK